MKKSETRKYNYSKVSLVIGIVSLIAWIIPIMGGFISIIGIVLALKSYKGIKKNLSAAGLVLCIIGLLAAVINVSIWAYKGASAELITSPSGVTFCKNVDKDLNAISASTTFATGDVYVRLKTSSIFDTTKLKVTIYKIEGIKESIYTSEEQVVNQDWTSIAVPITFEEPGKFRVLFTRFTDNHKLGQGILTIK